MQPTTNKVALTGYQQFVIAILALTQFSVILDFMVMSPLGDMLMKSMSLTPAQFGGAVSAYAFSAGISGLLTAGFADRYDRKKLFLFFYVGFIVGTLFCGLAGNYVQLILARIVTGIFGGVIGSISMAIIADVFDVQVRGRVMGFIQMGFGASQALGVPISLKIANHFGWQAPFFTIVILSAAIAAAIFLKMKPVTQHLTSQHTKDPVKHLMDTVAKKDYRVGFMATALLSVGGFMMMPFGSAFAINNLHLSQFDLPTLFMVSGIASLVIMPLVGFLSDKMDKFALFALASIWMIAVVILYTHLGASPLWMVMIFNITMMMGILSRMVPATAIVTGIPEMKDRGAFMSINSSLQQIAGGVAAVIAGRIVKQPGKGLPLQHYDVLGFVVSGLTIIAIIMMFRVSSMVKKKAQAKPQEQKANALAH